MENKELKKYDLMVILDAKLGAEEKEAIYKEVKDIVTQSSAKLLNSRVWLERQKFTFVIKRCKEGTYYLINFEAEGHVVAKIEAKLKIYEKILRYALVAVESTAAATIEPLKVA